MIATAYLRLAEKKAGAKDNRDNLYAAVELAKSGLELDAKSMAFFKALEGYNKAIAKLEKSSQPQAPAHASSTDNQHRHRNKSNHRQLLLAVASLAPPAWQG